MSGSSSQAAQLRMRAREDELYQNELKLKEDFKLSALADWEVKTSKTIAKRQIELRAKKLADEEVRIRRQADMFMFMLHVRTAGKRGATKR